MKNIYFAWWADSIIRIKVFNPKMQDWEMKIFILNTTLNALNYWVIIIWLKYLNILKIPLLTLDIFPGDVIDNVISAIINFATPFIILNYFLVFQKNRYEKIVSLYQDGKLNIAFPYAVISVCLSAITVLMYGLFWN
jgi:hypothetical protein